MSAAIAGFALSFSLILAIGSQNAFVLRQGIRGAHVGLVVFTCAVSDAALIAAGVAGFGKLTEVYPWLVPLMRWSGAAFLSVYGALSFYRAYAGSEHLEASNVRVQSAPAVVLTCLALTWLNPHVYLDTLVLIGAVASQYGDERWIFGAGAIAASAVFFVSLGYGARMLQPLFAKPSAWRALDAGVGILMSAIALALVVS